MPTVSHHNNMRSHLETFLTDLFDAFSAEEDDLCQKNMERIGGDTLWMANMCTGSGLNDEMCKAHYNHLAS